MITKKQVEAVERLAQVDPKVRETVSALACEVGRTPRRDYEAMRARHVATYEDLIRSAAIHEVMTGTPTPAELDSWMAGFAAQRARGGAPQI